MERQIERQRQIRDMKRDNENARKREIDIKRKPIER